MLLEKKNFEIGPLEAEILQKSWKNEIWKTKIGFSSAFWVISIKWPPIDFPGSQCTSLQDRSDFPEGLYDLPDVRNDLPKAPRDLPETHSHLLRPHVIFNGPMSPPWRPKLPPRDPISTPLGLTSPPRGLNGALYESFRPQLTTMRHLINVSDFSSVQYELHEP